MAKEYTIEEKHDGRAGGQKGMRDMAGKSVDSYISPQPKAEPPPIDPFPRPVIRGLWISAAAGALLGLIFGWLASAQIITIGGWEGLFSVEPFTFVAFWVFIGAALGIFFGGIGAILLAQPRPRRK